MDILSKLVIYFAISVILTFALLIAAIMIGIRLNRGQKGFRWILVLNETRTHIRFLGFFSGLIIVAALIYPLFCPNDPENSLASSIYNMIGMMGIFISLILYSIDRRLAALEAIKEKPTK